MHKVQLRKGFTGERRNRASISVARAEAFEGRLTDEQLEAVEADPELTVTELKVETEATTSKKTSTVRKMTDKAKKG